MATASTKPATLEDFLRAEAEAPEGVELALIDGEIVELGAKMTTRGPRHNRAISRLCFLLWKWLSDHPALAGGIDASETRCRLSRDPERVVGVDVGVWLGEEFETPPNDPPLYDAPPALAIEVLSPSDKHEDLLDKLKCYLDSGVPVVWYVDPDLQTVTVYHPGEPPVMYNSRQTIPVDPALPGLTLAVAEIFPTKTTRKSI